MAAPWLALGLSYHVYRGRPDGQPARGAPPRIAGTPAPLQGVEFGTSPAAFIPDSRVQAGADRGCERAR
jgi:hypothetical protein